MIFCVTMTGLSDGYSTAYIAGNARMGKKLADTGQCAIVLELWTRKEVQEKKQPSLAHSGTSGHYCKGFNL